MNTAIFRSLIWQLKILTVVFGILLLSLVTTENFYVFHIEAEFFLGVLIITFMITVIWIIFALIDALSENELLSKLDFFFHVVGGVLLIIGSICWFVATAREGGGSGWRGRHYIQRIFAGIFGILDGLLYIFIGFWLFRSASSHE